MKAYAEKRGLEHYRHRQPEEAVSELIRAEKDEKLVSGWSVCLRLRSNFYEGFMTREDVELSLSKAEEFVGVMKRVLGKISRSS